MLTLSLEERKITGKSFHATNLYFKGNTMYLFEKSTGLERRKKR